MVALVLHRLGARGPVAAVADLGDIVQADSARRGEPGGADADIVDRQDAALILERKQHRPPHCRLEPGAVMVGRVVVAQVGMKAADDQFEMVVREILQLKAFDFEGHLVEFVGFDHHFCQHTQRVPKAAGYEQIELTESKRGRRGTVVNRAKLDVAEAAQLNARGDGGIGGRLPVRCVDGTRRGLGGLGRAGRRAQHQAHHRDECDTPSGAPGGQIHRCDPTPVVDGRSSLLAGAVSTFSSRACLERAYHAATTIYGLLIAFIIATIYVVARRRIRVLASQPVICGLAYGVIAYLVMNYAGLPSRMPDLVALSCCRSSSTAWPSMRSAAACRARGSPHGPPAERGTSQHDRADDVYPRMWICL